jgi:hypothetical protein
VVEMKKEPGNLMFNYALKMMIDNKKIVEDSRTWGSKDNGKKST